MRVTWTGTRAELVAAVRDLPGVLSGRLPDRHGLGRVFLAALGDKALDLIYRAFRNKRLGREGSDGVRWAPLADATKEIRRRKGVTHGHRLEETGELMASLEPAGPDPDAPRPANQVFDIEPGAVTVGTRDPKADFHQKGTEHMPARPIVPDVPPAEWDRALEGAGAAALETVLELLCSHGGV